MKSSPPPAVSAPQAVTQQAEASRPLSKDQQAEALFMKGLAAQRAGQLEDAVKAYSAAIHVHPADARFPNNMGVALRLLKKYAAAEVYYRRSLSLQPKNSGAWVNLGNVLRDQGKLEEAEAAYRASLAVSEGDTRGACCGLGLVMRDLKRPDESVAWLERALAFAPEDADLHWDMAQSLLMQGDYRRGFAEYEWRWLSKDLARPALPGPAWVGERMEGKRLLLFGEQGFGDVIQFARFLPMAAERSGAEIILQVREPLVPLLTGQLPGGALVVPRGKRPPPFDAHAALLSVPHILGLSAEDIPRGPYLQPVPRPLRLPRRNPESRLRIGLVWQGSPTQKNDRNRSLAFDQLLPLLRHTSASFVSFQKGAAAQDPADHRVQGLAPSLDPHLKDFADTSAALADIDLLISVDTAVIHLAAAMGKPVWVLLSVFHDWRFDRNDQIVTWYPNVRVFKQSTAGDWKSVVRRVDQALETLLETLDAPTP